MIGVLKIVYNEKLDDIVDTYNNPYYGTIKMKPIDVKTSTYKNFSVENDLNSEEIIGNFYEKELLKTYQAEFMKEKVIKKRINYMLKWEDYDNSGST